MADDIAQPNIPNYNTKMPSVFEIERFLRGAQGAEIKNLKYCCQ